ncbi:MAG: hypothetical protein NT062_00120, partial [Proteobacteria bacterium]|nr:hypothetical protein [Pseudomonadota bacterium]
MPERVLAGDVRGGAGVVGRWAARQVTTAWQARLVGERSPAHAARTQAFVDAVVAETGVSPRDPELALATMDVMQNCISQVARLR